MKNFKQELREWSTADLSKHQEIEGIKKCCSNSANYIEILEKQITILQSDNNLSLNSLRAERDGLKIKLEQIKEILKD